MKLTDASGQLPRNWAGKQAYRMEGVAAGKPRDLVLVPSLMRERTGCGC